MNDLLKRVKKWDLILNEVHEDLKFLHQEFDLVYKAIQELEVRNNV